MKTFNLSAAAKYLGIHPLTLRRYCDNGIAPAHTFIELPTGYCKVTFTQESLDAWKRKGTQDGYSSGN